MHSGKNSIFNAWCWPIWIFTYRRMQIGSYLSSCTQHVLKWIKDLNINPHTLSLIEKKVGNILEHIGRGDNFLNRIPVTQTLRSITKKRDLKKLKSLFKAKDMVNWIKKEPIDWKKIFTNSTADRGLTSKIYKEIKKLDIKS